MDGMDYMACFVFGDDEGNDEWWQGYVPSVPRAGDLLTMEDGRKGVVKRVEWHPRDNRRMLVSIFVERLE